MASGGSYRITSTTNTHEFPAPTSAEWEISVLGAGLNGIPRLSSYNKHRWNWEALEGPDMEALIDFYLEQINSGAQLTSIETDPFDASGACETYGTTVYNDWIFTSLSTIVRGLPVYNNVSAEFEVYTP